MPVEEEVASHNVLHSCGRKAILRRKVEMATENGLELWELLEIGDEVGGHRVGLLFEIVACDAGYGTVGEA